MDEPHDVHPPARKVMSLSVGAALLVVAAVILALCSGFIVQAFRGPRVVTEQELLAGGPTGWFDNYVSYTPAQPAVDTGLQWGKKNNPGTKFLLLPVGDRLMLCSARIANTGPTFVGRLGPATGSTEEEVLTRVRASAAGPGPRLMPVMLQAVRSIWFDTIAALVFAVGTGVCGLLLLVRGLWMKTESPRPPRARRDEPREDEDY